MIVNLFLFLGFLFILIKSADFSINYSYKLAKSLSLSEFIISFFIVTIISILPETIISIFSSLRGMPEFGVGTLIGSNIADLTLVFGIIALVSVKGVKIKSEILKENYWYLGLLFLPVLFGLDGFYSIFDGLLLILFGLLFFITLSIDYKKSYNKKIKKDKTELIKNFILLILSLAILLISASYTIKSAINFANDVKIPPILISLTIISVGTCLPELLFSTKAVKDNHDSLALGDLLGTVITDSTIILGIVIILNPFYVNYSLVYITCISMFLSGVLCILFINSGKILTKKEAVYLLLFYIIYLIIEFIVKTKLM
ncbi:MAG: sodium:calcium antiporter [Nanoarchaeota archaeon]